MACMEGFSIQVYTTNLEGFVCMSETFLIEVGHTHSISQPDLLTMRQASQKGIICKEVERGCREVNLIQGQL